MSVQCSVRAAASSTRRLANVKDSDRPKREIVIGDGSDGEGGARR